MEKEDTLFFKHKGKNGKFYFESCCKECSYEKKKEYNIKWRKDNVKHCVGYNRKRFKQLKDAYGLGSGTIKRIGFRTALFVYDRAKRKCQICGEENYLTIHHIDHKGRNNQRRGLPQNNNIDNLIVICRSCHGKIHGKEGKGIKHNKLVARS